MDFTPLALPATQTQQLDSLHRAGLSNVRFSHDVRNTFAKKSGAYLGEPLPKGGEGIEIVETSKYPTLEAENKGGRNLLRARLRAAPEPTFSGSETYGDGLKRRLDGKGRETGFPSQGKLNVYNGVPYSGGISMEEISDREATRSRAMEAQAAARSGSGKKTRRKFISKLKL
jgi:hypothetical protein